MSEKVVSQDRFEEIQRKLAMATMYEDTLKYIAGESHLTVDTLEEAREAAMKALEETGAIE